MNSGFDPDHLLGAVRLGVSDQAAQREFYERVIGLGVLEVGSDLVVLGVGDRPILELEASPGAAPPPPRSTGLFHLAILVPDRSELARAGRRIADAGWRLSGVADHLVSEALYLDDPEGNGIEIYRDRPRSEWSYEGDELQMATLPLDLEALLASVDKAGPSMAAGARLGHVHLKAADLAQAQSFYADVIGLEVTARSYRDATFLSTGGYHHHIGINTWTSSGAPPPPAGSRGLQWFELLVPGADDLAQMARGAEQLGLPVGRGDARLRLADPSGNRIVATVAG